jgi:hypothetical protein
MHNGVELVRKLSVEIVTDALGARKTDDTDGPLQKRFPQKGRGNFFMAERGSRMAPFTALGKLASSLLL